MSEGGPLARGPIAPADPPAVVAGWEVSRRRTTAALHLADWTPLAKVLVRATPTGDVARALGVACGRAARDPEGTLVVRPGPDEWMLLAPPGRAPDLVDRVVPDEPLVTVVDITSSRALLRLTGPDAPELLAKVCAVDLAGTPNGTALRTSVAGVVTEVVRDDESERSYLLACDWSFGQYLFDALLDAGSEFALQVNGFFFEENGQ